MKICILIPGRGVGGGIKMSVRMASVLAVRHDVTLLSPRIPNYTLHQKLRRTGARARALHIAREWWRAPRTLFFARDLDPRVRLAEYLLEPSAEMLNAFDVIVYVSVWQFHEIPAGVRTPRVHWTLADYFFGSGTGSRIDVIMDGYLGGDAIVAPSAVTARDLASYGIPIEGIVPGGVDPVFTDAGRAAAGPRVRVLGYFQPAWWVKGGATLLQCMRRLRLEHPDAEIALFGHQGSDVVEGGKAVCDRFYSGLDSAGVARLLREHDVFVYPSYTDGFPSPPLEAMACGCAVAATRVGAVPEYGRDGVNMLMVEPMNAPALFEAADRLVRDAGLRTRLSAQAAADARAWTWDAAGEKFERLLTELVSVPRTQDAGPRHQRG